MPLINDELLQLLLKRNILMRDPLKKDDDEDFATFFARKEKENNVHFHGASNYKENYKINPLIPKYPVSLGFEKVALNQELNKVASRSGSFSIID